MDFPSYSPYNETMDKYKVEQQSSQPNAPPQVVEKAETELQEPSLYHVVLLNDDYTPMNFVIDLLMQLFQKNYDDAHAIMMQVHEREQGIAGTYPYEIAEEKMRQVNLSAQANEFPLTSVIEAA